MNEFLNTLPELNASSEPSVELYVLGAALLIAVLMVAFATYSRRQYLRLPELRLQSDSVMIDQGNLDHCVIIPARNEEAVIGRAVRSFPDSLTVVIDDHSTDQTVARAVEAGAVVRPAQPLERGWLGKPNACWTGALYTDSAWILFTDADTWYEPRFLPSMLGYASANALHAVTVFPRQELGKWYEKLLVPYVHGLWFTGISARHVDDPKHPEALANSQCLLFRRTAYNFIGGHKAVASNALEDVALARLIKRHRMSIAVLRCESVAHVRMYSSFGSMWRGLQKHSFRVLRSNARATMIVILAALITTSWVPLMAALLFYNLALPALLFFFVPVLAWSAWYRSIFRALLVPLAICFFPAIAVSALIKAIFGIKTDWKGRRV